MSEKLTPETLQYVPILWEGGYSNPDYEVIRGHVALEVALRVLEAEGIVPRHPKIIHTYARWVPDSTKQYDMVFHLSSGGRGTFPVTLVKDQPDE